MIQQEIKAAPAASLSCLFIERDRSGYWVVKDARSLCGGLFANRTEGIKFAMYECQRRPQSVIMLPDGLELHGPLDEHDAGSRAKRIAAQASPVKSVSTAAEATGMRASVAAAIGAAPSALMTPSAEQAVPCTAPSLGRSRSGLTERQSA